MTRALEKALCAAKIVTCRRRAVGLEANKPQKPGTSSEEVRNEQGWGPGTKPASDTLQEQKNRKPMGSVPGTALKGS